MNEQSPKEGEEMKKTIGQIKLKHRWKSIQTIQIKVGGVWKEVCAVEINKLT